MKHVLLVLLSCNYLLPIFAQDVYFSQQQSNRLYLNPANAGFNQEAHAFTAFKAQWPDVSLPFVSYCASYDQYVKTLHGGIGGYIMNDMQGSGMMNNLSALAMYSYHAKVGKTSYLMLGAQAGYEQFFQNTDKMIFGDMFDPATSTFGFGSVEKFNKRSFGAFDFGTGIVYKGWNHINNVNYNFGVAVHHLSQPTMLGGHQLKRKYTGHFYMSRPFMKNRFGRDFMYLHPHLVFQMQDQFNIIDYGSILTIDNVIAGLSFRNNYQFDFITVSTLIGYRWYDYTLKYSFDFTPHGVSLFLSHLGIHEVTFLLNLQYKGNNSAKRNL